MFSAPYVSIMEIRLSCRCVSLRAGNKLDSEDVGIICLPVFGTVSLS